MTLPVRRWPLFILKVLLTIIAPQRWAIRAELEVERLRLKLAAADMAAVEFEIEQQHRWQELSALHASDKRQAREANEHDRNRLESLHTEEMNQYDEANKKAISELRAATVYAYQQRDETAKRLTAERERHAETKQKLAEVEGTKQVVDDQLVLLVQWRQAELERLLAEARIQAARGQRPQQEQIE